MFATAADVHGLADQHVEAALHVRDVVLTDQLEQAIQTATFTGWRPRRRRAPRARRRRVGHRKPRSA